VTWLASDPEAIRTRRATVSDADALAEAHRDSIRSIGPAFYPPQAVDDWCEGLSPNIYARAMDNGEAFFVAIGDVDGRSVVLGFASDYQIDGARFGVSVYVRGSAARRGIGSALLRLAEADAAASGATSLHIEASLAGIAFYRAHRFIETGRGEALLTCGRTIACAYMWKPIG
jgi:putative acetyltransferase